MTEATHPSPQSILVLGAGELGLPVLRNLARVAKHSPGSTISVLLRDSTINTQAPEKKREIDELRSLGIQLVAADLVNDSIDQLANTQTDFANLPAGTRAVALPDNSYNRSSPFLTPELSCLPPKSAGMRNTLVLSSGTGISQSQRSFTTSCSREPLLTLYRAMRRK